MRKYLFAMAIAAIFISCNSEQKGDEQVLVKGATETPPVEFADPKLGEAGKASLRHFEAGDIDAFVSNYADNAVFMWSSGDSLAGKEAIAKYWKDRRSNVIEKITFSNDIWLPIKINKPQQGHDLVGNWVLAWFQVDVTYKTGKSLSFWIHEDHHFNAEGKVDRVIQYLDRAPIMEATKP